MNFVWPDAMTDSEREQARLDAREQKVLGFVAIAVGAILILGLYLILAS